MSITAAASGTASNSSLAILVGRVLLSILFILAGYSKLTAISATAGWFGSIGLPMPTVTTVVVGLVELLGGYGVAARPRFLKCYDALVVGPEIVLVAARPRFLKCYDFTKIGAAFPSLQLDRDF